MVAACALVLACANASAGALTGKQAALEAGFDAACIADYEQSAQIAAHPGMYETNPMLGRHPSRARLRNYFFGVVAVHLAITRILGERARGIWQGATLFIEAGQVARNARLGLKVEF